VPSQSCRLSSVATLGMLPAGVFTSPVIHDFLPVLETAAATVSIQLSSFSVINYMPLI
jgi:hypothetical protein